MPKGKKASAHSGSAKAKAKAGAASFGGSKDKGLARLEELFALMNRSGVAELEWEQGGERIKVRTPAACVGVAMAPVASHTAIVPPVVHHAAAVGTQPAPGAKSTDAAKPASNHKQVASPFVGTFYRAASPTAEPYVRDGQTVKRGDVLCIIEAMKLMNEIEAEFSGKIVSCLIENGQPVEFGEPLFLIEP